MRSKKLFAYLLRSKRGVLGTVIFSAAAMILSALIFAADGIRDYQFVMSRHSEVDIQEMYKNYPNWQDSFFRYTESFKPELVSLIAAAVGFLFLCDCAFRFGIANGVSRKNVTRTTLLCVPVTAAVTTVISQLIRLFIIRHTLFYCEDCIYSLIFELDPSVDIPDEKWDAPLPLSHYLELREVLMYFGIMLALLTLVCCLYALFRRFGIYGVVCGALVCTAVWSLAYLMWNGMGELSKMMKSFYIITEPNVYMSDHDYFIMYEPRALSFVLTAVIVIAVNAAVYRISLKSSAISAIKAG